MRKNSKRTLIVILITGLLISSLFLIRSDWLVIKEAKTGETIFYKQLDGKMTFAIKYLHSVERTPVWEYFKVENKKLYLTGTKYESYGAGLPFLKKHTYIVKDGEFEIKDINQKLAKIPLRVSDYAKHRFIIGDQEYKLYKLTKPKSLVLIEVKNMNLLKLLKLQVLEWLQGR